MAELIAASVACNVKVHVCGADGVPVIAPVPASSDNPSHSLPPPFNDHVTGALQLAVCGVCEYADPTVPPGREPVVIEHATSGPCRIDTAPAPLSK